MSDYSIDSPVGDSAVTTTTQNNPFSTTGMAGLTGYDSKNYASDTYADIINQQYDDYRERFLPYEQKIMSLADSSQLLDEQLGRLTTNIDNNYSSLGQQQSMMNQRYGLTQSTSQTQSQNRNTDINKALATAHGENNTRIANADMKTGMLTGASNEQQNFTSMGG